jgi:hypothetical protein
MYRLTDIVLDRVDVVDQPANPHASILIWKSAPQPPKPVPLVESLRGLMAGKREGRR